MNNLLFQAHIISGSGFISGLTHPLLGLDHLLAMIAVGIMGGLIGGRGAYVVPATFVSFMIAGGIAAISGITFPLVETGISLSVLFFGILITSSASMPLWLASGCAALFALFHGHSHGEGLYLIANPAAYFLGFILSTALLHLCGVTFGLLGKQNLQAQAALRWAGVSMSLIGLLFLFQEMNNLFFS